MWRLVRLELWHEISPSDSTNHASTASPATITMPTPPKAIALKKLNDALARLWTAPGPLGADQTLGKFS